MKSIRLFVGFDPREAVGTYVFLQSLRENSTMPVDIRFIGGAQKDGTNAFTYERFAIPERCGWSGWALYVDAADMLLRACLSAVWAMQDKRYGVMVAKHDYLTKHQRKYVGTELEAENRDYPRKNWSSVVLWNCGHMAHFEKREEMRHGDGAYLHRFGWLKDEQIGELPREWNWLDEYGENADAKLLHWTNGIPGFNAYRGAPHAAEWLATLRRTLRGLQTDEKSRLLISER